MTTKDENDVLNSCCLLASWLETWKNEEGAYLGFVVHRCDLKRMFKIHDDTWAQSPIINGYLNIFKKTNDKRWLKRAETAGNLLIDRLNPITGKYKYAGWENDKSTTLAHCALADCALLNLSQVNLEIGKIKESKKYVKAARTNIDNYLIKVLWNPEIQAFQFGDIDPYSPLKKRYIANMNSVAVEALIKLSKITGENNYLRKFAIPLGHWLLTQQVETNGIENGGISYSNIQPKVIISIYTALAMRGLDDLYLETGEREYAKMMEKSSSHLIKMRDPNTRLFYHGIFDNHMRKYPQFVAGAGIILKALNDTMNVSNKKYDLTTTIKAILKEQLPIGGFSNFYGYDTPENGRKKGLGHQVWEDIVPVIGWNGYLFEFLTEILPTEINFRGVKIKRVCISHSNFFYREDSKECMIIGKKSIESIGFYKYFKKRKYGFAITPIKMFNPIHRLIRKAVQLLVRIYKKLLVII